MKMDGKNREEQENGAKVRDLEEYKAENRKRKRRRRITVGILAGAILAAGIGTGANVSCLWPKIGSSRF